MLWLCVCAHVGALSFIRSAGPLEICPRLGQVSGSVSQINENLLVLLLLFFFFMITTTIITIIAITILIIVIIVTIITTQRLGS